jgi:hypothetical protein
VLLLTRLPPLADGLDRSHQQRVERIDCRARNGGIVVLLRASQATDLEIWAAERSAQAFLEIYGLPLTVARAKP